VSKFVPINLLTHIRSGGTTLAWGMKITRTDGAVYGWTSHDRDAAVDGVMYMSGPGLDVASLVSTAGFEVDNTEATMLTDEAIITRSDVLAGRWDGAAFELFRYNWASPSDGRDIRKVGNLGNVQPKRGAFVVELRGLRQRLQETIGNITQPTCRNRLGDAKCGVDLTGSPNFSATGTLTSVTSGRVFRDSSRVEPADWFAEGEIRFDSGLNVNLRAKVTGYGADGTITLGLGMLYDLSSGDAYTMTAGCGKRLLDDCKAKFNNVLNFNGEPHLPGADAVTAPPDFS
jgi:uncharacterized phage protein (TIGR02218 family)